MGSDIHTLAASSGGSGAFNLLLLLAVPLVFYFLLIRPQSRRRKEQMNMQSSIAPGTKVITTAGMHATVVEVHDDGIVLEIAPGVEAKFVKQAVMQVLKDEPADEELDGDEPDETPDAAAKDDAASQAKAVDVDDVEEAGKTAVKAGVKADAKDEDEAPAHAGKADKPSA
ncbi:preprotein translocase subunit YajC [Actinomadura harenae]|uniref:Preprotein translocase subunit YajC n=1 Tax=Actinomadura harenae TaxID=2483351 RepID=A0A3M2M2H5_9ACTN|nr:preprotein translocase subunit YajC [Actinomadura harenae]RMI42685.1 preprotein translocase subunit YajC [Actinomadura harenae]